MKKALSIILCLSMLMTVIPMQAFAAPVKMTTGTESIEEFVADTQTEESDAKAELAGDDTVAPKQVKPADGETVDRRYPVAYYTFPKSVVIDKADVTLENLNNSNAGGVYFDEETNSVWVFPKDLQNTVYKNDVVSYDAWTSNIVADNGMNLFFPAVSFKLSEEVPADGTNLVPFGNHEYGWSPFDYAGDSHLFSLVQDPTDPDNHVTLRSWESGKSPWLASYADVRWRPGSTYKIVAKVMVDKFLMNSGATVATSSSTITPNPIYHVPSFSCTGTPSHPNQTGSKCTVCGENVDREHGTSFHEHPVQTAAATVSTTNGVSNGWQTITTEITVRDNMDDEYVPALSIYSNPSGSSSNYYATQFYIDDVEVYEQVDVSFGAGRYSEQKRAGRDERAKSGFMGDVVTLPKTSRSYQSSTEGYVMSGWTDGKKVYADDSEYTITGPAHLTPYMVPEGDGYTVKLSVPEEFADSYDGICIIEEAVGVEIDLDTEDFALDSVFGYVCEGWRNKKTGTFVTKVSGAADEVIELEAVYSVRTGIVLDSEKKMNEIRLQGATAVYDSALVGATVTPASNLPRVFFESLELSADDYSYVDVTYVNNSDLEASAGGKLYFIVSGISTVTNSYVARGSKIAEDGNNVTYRYDLSASKKWAGICSAIAVVPYEATTPFTVKEIRFVQDEIVPEIAINGLAAPVISQTPDMEVTAGSDAYVVESIEWDLDGEYFAGRTVYTAVMNVKINKGGYMFGDETIALVDGEEAYIEVNEENSSYAVVTKVFEKTADPAEIDINFTCANTIETNNGTLELTAEIVPVNPADVIAPDTLTWEITGGDEGIAVLEGTTLTAIWDGTVILTATPEYDEEQAEQFEVTISGQVGYTVTYDKGTGADVSNMPEAERAKNTYRVSADVPVREGYAFSGWTYEVGASETVKSFEIENDVTLYAKWTKGGYVADFDNAGDSATVGEKIVKLSDNNTFSMNSATVSELNTDNSEVLLEIDGDDFYVELYAGSTTAINVDYVSKVIVGYRTDIEGDIAASFFFATKGATGSWIGPNYSTNPDKYTGTNHVSIDYTMSGDINEIQEIEVDVTGIADFRGYLNHVRFDIIEGSRPYIGKNIYIDYIKLEGATIIENVDLTLDAPVASAVASDASGVTTKTGEYKAVGVEWTGDKELIDGKYFDDEAVYTATIEVEAEDGGMLSEVPYSINVNGEKATFVSSENGVVKLSYTFPATKKLADITFVAGVADGPAEITEPYGTLQLMSDVFFEEDVDIDEIDGGAYWSIDESQTRYATVDENGLVTANLDCDEVIVTARSKYDPSKTETVSVKISGQIPESTVTFATGTGERVTGLPTTRLAKGKYTLPTDIEATRRNYVIVGWSKELGGEIILEDEVYEDTTYYAVWGYAKTEEFDDVTKMSDTIFTENAGFSLKGEQDGVITVVPTNPLDGSGKPKTGIQLMTNNNGVFTGATNKVKQDNIEFLEIKTTVAPENLELLVYVVSSDDDFTTNVTAWNETACTRFYSNRESLAGNPDNSVFDIVTQNGEWYVYRIPTSKLKNWNNYLKRVRINFVQRDMKATGGSDNGWISYPEGTEHKFDYVRFIGRDIPVMDITDLAAPVVKGEAATTATAAQKDAFEITDITWSPELLGGLFFGSGIEYTATITVAPLKGYYALSNPPAKVTVNGEEEGVTFKRKNATYSTITYTFPATEDIGELELVTVKLVEQNDDGTVEVENQIFSGDDFDLNKFVPQNTPTGYRWNGWSETEGGELISGTINITEDTTYYAVYDVITEYDFSQEAHRNFQNVSATDASVKFDGAWAVVTPKYSDSAAKLVLTGLNVDALDYDYVEVIYDGTLEEGKFGNKFSLEATPVLFFDGDGTDREATLVEVEEMVASKRVSYKFTYDLTDGLRPSKIKGFTLAPYAGNPSWAVTSVRLIKNKVITEPADITLIDAPETWGKPDKDAEITEGYAIESISWNGSKGFNTDGSFKDGAAYTVTVAVKAATGYKIVEVAGSINGNTPDSIEDIGGGVYTISYTFEATEAFKPFELSLEGGAITTPDGTLKLTPVFTYDEPIATEEVIWTIEDYGSDDKETVLLSDDGVITACYDAEAVIIRATSVYNPAVYAEATVVVSGQVPYYTVKFDKNTLGTVTGMPDSVQTKYDYTLPTTVPVREGFIFAGWSKKAGDKVTITKDYIAADTTYYALWVKGLSYEFTDDKQFNSVNQITPEYDTENGVVRYTPSGSDPIIMVGQYGGPALFPGNDYRTFEVRIKASKEATYPVGMYFTSVDANGHRVSYNYDNDPAHQAQFNANMSNGNVKIGPDGYTYVTFDLSSKTDWTDAYIDYMRIDIPNGNAVGVEFEMDYLRVVNYETGIIEVTGVQTPVARDVALYEATSKDASKYTVTKVEWEGDDLISDYYFDGNSEYTVAVTVKGVPGYFVSDAPTLATVNGKPAESTSYNIETGELTLRYTFPATADAGNTETNNITLVSKNDSWASESETKSLFVGGTFPLSTYMPKTVPSGYRWIGWAEEDGAELPSVDGDIAIEGDKTYYSVYEELVEFDYSNYFHTIGTVSKSGTPITFDGTQAVVKASAAADALITPAMNVDSSEFGFVEVYYNAYMSGKVGNTNYANKFTTKLDPALNFSTMSAPKEYISGAAIVDVESVVIDGVSCMKYTYDMASVAGWKGNIASLSLAPYAGYPDWAVKLIRLVPTEEITASADFTVAQPEAFGTPATAADVSVNSEYVVTDIKWTPAVDEFKAETVYTAKITYKAASGYKLSSLFATVNGENVAVDDNGDGTFSVAYTFEQSEPLKDITVVISGTSKIGEPGRYAQMTAKVTADDGSRLPVIGVTWSVDDETVATIAPDSGRLTPVSNGTVTVRATSKYNPEVYDEHEVELVGQANLVRVVFDKNTQAEVEGMPGDIYTVGTWTPDPIEDAKIKRDGAFFLGWSTDEDSRTVGSSFSIVNDETLPAGEETVVTLYAVWGTGFEFSFDNAETSLNIQAGRSVTYKDGVATITPTAALASGSKGVIMSYDQLFQYQIETKYISAIETRFSTPVPNMVKWYVQSSLTGEDNPWPGDPSIPTSFWNEDADVITYNRPANAEGEFQVVSLSLEGHAPWLQYPYARQLRLDMDANVMGENSVSIDYVRLISKIRTVQFNGNGGEIPFGDGYTVEVTNKIKYELGDITLPADPTREGYKFIGWAKTPDRTEEDRLYTKTFPVTDDVVLYATWTPAAVIDEETVTADGEAEVVIDNEGSAIITSAEAVTVTVDVADTMEVGENKIVVVEFDYNLEDVEDGSIYLEYVDANGDPQRIEIASGLNGVGGEDFTADLFGEESFDGTITDVKIVLPTAKYGEDSFVDDVYFTTPEIAAGLLASDSEAPSDNNASVSQGIGEGKQEVDFTPPYPSIPGNTGVTEHQNSTTKTPSDKKVPTRPKDTGSTTPSTPSTPGTPTTPTKPEVKFPMGTYTKDAFKDVKSGDWYYNDVYKSFGLGLMKGTSDTTFDPNGTITIAQAITVAARMNAIYYGQTIPAAAAGEAWYKPFVDYATRKGVISAGQYADVNALATREQVAVMFVRALPATWYNAINMFTEIPDVPASSSYFAVIQRLYNAGIVIGVDKEYNFNPTSNIKRSEISAIINRVADKESRIREVTEAEKANNVKVVDASWLIANATVGNCVEKTFIDKDGLAYAMPAKNDPIVNSLNTMLGGATLNADEFSKISVVLKTSDISKVAGMQSKIYFANDTVKLSEANTVRTTWPSTASADGTVTLTFNMKSNAAWAGEMTVVRFDPFDFITDFSVVSITFAP